MSRRDARSCVAGIVLSVFVLAACAPLAAQDAGTGLPLELTAKVEKLVGDLASDAFDVREAANKEIPELLKDPASFDAVLQLLKTRLDTTSDAEVKRRLEAITGPYLALGLTPALMDKFPAVAGQLDSPDPEVRCGALEELGKSRHPDAVKPLVKALDNPKTSVCGCVCRWLGELGDDRAVEPLVGIAVGTKEFELRQAAFSALAAIGRTAAAEMAKGGEVPVEPLLDNLDSGDAKARTRALKVLFASDLGPDALAAVERRLKDRQDVRRDLLQALVFRAGILCQVTEGSFDLIISNQSFAHSEVDIEVRVDGRLAVKADFNVGTQHNYRSFLFDLKPGKHKIAAVTSRGNAKYEGEFEIGQKKRWGILNYWYYTKGDRGPETPEQFMMRLMDEQPMFD